MLKLLLISFVLLFSHNANAGMSMSAGQALSNQTILMAPSSLKKASNPAPKKEGIIAPQPNPAPVVEQPVTKKVDLTESHSATVQLKKNDMVEITLKQEAGYSWVLPSVDGLQLISNTPTSASRIVIYRLTSNTGTEAYFDYVNKDKKIDTTKQLTIELRK